MEAQYSKNDEHCCYGDTVVYQNRIKYIKGIKGRVFIKHRICEWMEHIFDFVMMMETGILLYYFF